MFRFRVFSTLIFALLVQPTLSIYQQYEDCEPKHCGDGLNISYPFWIHEQHKSYCGESLFRVTCIDDKPTIRISDEDYIIRDISQGSHSVLVVDKDVFYGTCPTPMQNISLVGAPFRFSPNYADLYFFYNCTSGPTEYYTYPIVCGGTTRTGLHSFAAFLHDLGLRYVNASSMNCETMVNAPVEIRNGMTSESMMKVGYINVLREGFVLSWPVADNCTKCEKSGGRCGFQHSKFVCLCRDGPHGRICRKGWSVREKAGLGLLAAIGCVLMMAILILCWKLSYLSSNSIMFWKKKEKRQRVVEDFLKNYGSLVPRRYNYYDIKMITSSFKDKIGHGGFGEVYKGKLVDGRVVAVKVLNKDNGDGEEFINEVASISRTSHVNVVSLLGFCFDGSKRALIYEFMANGSLEKFIYDRNPLEAESHLGWERLYQIVIGVARGLEYLHRGCNTRILHFDIKPHNILLDQDFIPKISDFGLAKLCPRNESIISMLGARGTAGYIAPEVFSRQFGGVSHKSDVYSFGMMVLEIVGKRKNIDVQVDHTSEIYFPKWIYRRVKLNEGLGLRGITSKEEGEITRKMILVALWCIQTNPVDRPAMTKVVEMLEGRHESVSIPPKPYLCSPPRSPVGSSNT